VTEVSDDVALARARSMASPSYDYLGLDITGGGAGWVEVSLTVRDELLNGDGILHGGMWAVVADSSMGGAIRTVIDVERERAVTAQLDLRWLRPARGDTLRSVGRLVRRGRTLSHCTAELFDERGELVGAASGTFMVVPALGLDVDGAATAG
jgi:uncharacterized protein (TIGR00369 family)